MTAKTFKYDMPWLKQRLLTPFKKPPGHFFNYEGEYTYTTGLLDHCCIFCHPEYYNKMPPGVELCVRCGMPYYSGVDAFAYYEDNHAFYDVAPSCDLCTRCDKELRKECGF